jgi:hypothetical protein
MLNTINRYAVSSNKHLSYKELGLNKEKERFFESFALLWSFWLQRALNRFFCLASDEHATHGSFERDAAINEVWTQPNDRDA